MRLGREIYRLIHFVKWDEKTFFLSSRLCDDEALEKYLLANIKLAR